MNNKNLSVSLLSLTLLALGVTFYSYFREPIVLFSWLPNLGFDSVATPIVIPPWATTLAGSLPSFLYMFAFTLLLKMIPEAKPHQQWQRMTSFLILNIVIETAQSIVPALFPRSNTLNTNIFADYFYRGTFDLLDVVALFLGFFAAHASLPGFRLNLGSCRATLQRLAHITLLIGAGFSTMASILLTEPDHQRFRPDCTPVYQSFESIRDAVKTSVARPIAKNKKIYVKDNYLFVNARGQGIHVIDNSDPNSPENLLFIEIPGNVDLAIRGTSLYADSYTDLIVIDLTALPELNVTQRLESVFSQDLRHLEPAKQRSTWTIDPSQGIAVSCVEPDNNDANVEHVDMPESE